VRPTGVTRFNLALAAGGILLCGVLLGGLVALLAGLRLPTLGVGESPPATLSPTPSATASAQLPAADVAGEDLLALPRFPGSVRTDYEVALDERYRLIVTEYLAEADIDRVLAFYQGVIATQGWERADIGFVDGEWSYALVDGETLALIEIEEAGGLIEIDLQISEPVAVPTEPAAPAPTDAPPPPPPPPGDDDDD
jgi:hypothetical protein